MTKPRIDQLLIDSALQPELCRRMRESPNEVFKDFDLSEGEQEILRSPDHRLLPLLGAALARQIKSSASVEKTPVAAAPPTEVKVEAVSDAVRRALPDTLMALTVVPCALHENGQFKGITYVMWVNPLPEGTDPASLPAPAGTVLPGQPLVPLHAVLRISAVQSQDAAGNSQVSVWGSFQQSSSVSLPPPAESAGNPSASPFQSPVDSAPVKAAVAAVRDAPSGEKYDRLVDLLHALHHGDVR